MQGIDRSFDVGLSWMINEQISTYAWLYGHLLERVGPEETRKLWDAVPMEPDALTQSILSRGTQEEAEPCSADELAEGVYEAFERPIRGVDAEAAERFLRAHPPFSQIDEAHPSRVGVLSLTTYESLHLTRDALARIVEATIETFGKAGELMVYDALTAEWRAAITEKMSGEDFMKSRLARYENPPEEADIFSAGLNVELKHGDEKEILTHVTACEWARYFLERHPTVGYMLACSFDDPVYRLLTDGVRFQRRCTLMEDGDYCEFRFHCM